MKHIFLTGLIGFTVLFASCGGGESKTEVTESEAATTEQATAQYYCPMKCEGDKTYAEKGTCPVCKMDLVLKVEEQHEEHDHSHEGHQH